ncbi:hypothetical protein PQC38_gp035 [Aeromonas phage BUCT695]|uniref:hypothetical protein n=1 Tax=Aeromonas phage BUCT695 TaxID=2908630 RepID=UPI00232986FB|nr:hypothetical protein PQC38_gp035 [Aeromonas phage BUCT695]UIW10511.1 hypothetical protein [Aeromonas phage BUCT695]
MKTLTETLKHALDLAGKDLDDAKKQRKEIRKALSAIKNVRKALAEEIRGLKSLSRSLPNGLDKAMSQLLEWKRDQYRELSAQQPMMKWSLTQVNQYIDKVTPEVRDLDTHWEAAKSVDETNRLIAEGV